MGFLFSPALMHLIHEQDTICSGVEKKLKKTLVQQYPNVSIPVVSFCVCCKGMKKQRDEEECRFKGMFP
jgi:hypothetical protein